MKQGGPGDHVDKGRAEGGGQIREEPWGTSLYINHCACIYFPINSVSPYKVKLTKTPKITPNNKNT